MKKIKRAFALALASAMILGMFSMTASAATANITGSADNPISAIPVHKYVTATAGVALPDVKFYLQMAPATDLDGTETVTGAVDETTGEASSYKVEAGIPLANPVLEFEFNETNKTVTGSAEVDKSFDITSFADGETFDHSSIYRYYITEVTPSSEEGKYEAVQTDDSGKSYITYDGTKYIVDLFVTTKDGGYVVSGVSVQEDGKTEKPNEIAFTNSINCANITIAKVVKGALYENNEKFKFHIIIPKAGDTITLSANDTIQAQVYNTSNGSKVGEPFNLNVAGETIDDDIIGNGTEFELEAGQYLEITAPVSMIYQVIEEDYSDEGYTTEVTYKVDNGSGATLANEDGKDGKSTMDVTVDGKEMTCVAVRGTTNKVTNSVVFTNNRDVPEVGTGINLDFIPYVVVLALVVAAGSVLLVYKKKKTVR
jgi:uncharacterized cupredoxin-like copper-binding protein